MKERRILTRFYQTSVLTFPSKDTVSEASKCANCEMGVDPCLPIASNMNTCTKDTNRSTNWQAPSEHW